jgi:transposase
MSILTYKLKHNRNFATELQKATRVANYSLKHRKCRTTREVKFIGLKACIANQILKKYGNNKKLKSVSKVKLTINGYFVKVNKETREINIPSLKLKLNYQFPNNFIKVNQKGNTIPVINYETEKIEFISYRDIKKDELITYTYLPESFPHVTIR